MIVYVDVVFFENLILDLIILLATGINPILAKGSLRITFGRENNIDEVKYLVDSLEEIITKMRK